MIFVNVISYARPQILRRCIEGLLPGIRRAGDACLWVLEQGVRPNGQRAFAGNDRHWWVETNLGCAGGRKFLVEQACDAGLLDTDLMVFIDDDITATDDSWLLALVDPIVRGTADIAGFAPRMLTNDLLTRPCLPGETPDYVSGGWMAVSGTVFLAGVQFDERYSPNYWEDVDVCQQAWRAGFTVGAAHGVGLHHEEHEGDAVIANRSRRAFAEKWGLLGLLSEEGKG